LHLLDDLEDYARIGIRQAILVHLDGTAVQRQALNPIRKRAPVFRAPLGIAMGIGYLVSEATHVLAAVNDGHIE
jgi:hypothetical protein